MTAYYSFEPPPNTVQFIPTSTSVTPDPSKGLPTGKVNFSGRVRYTRQAASYLALRLFDKPTGGILQGSSDFINAAQTSGEQDLQITDFELKEEVTELYLKAVIINRLTESVSAETPPIKYSRLADLSISLKEVELVQVIQDEAKSVPLYQNKPTVLRVFVKQKGETDNPFTNVTAQVRALESGGASLPGTPTLLNQTNGITARETPNRAREDHSLNFLLPMEWTRGPVKFLVELIVPPGREEGPVDNNKLEIAVVFRPPVPKSRFKVDVVRICVNGGCPTTALKPETLTRLQDMFPLSPELITFGKFRAHLNWPPNASAIKQLTIKETDLYKRSGQNELFRYLNYVGTLTQLRGDIYLAILPAMPTKDGIAVPEGRASSVGALVPDRNKETEDVGIAFMQVSANTETAVHEVGHLFGLRHIQREDSCGAEDSKSNWEYPTARIADPGFDPLSGKLVSLLAPDIMSYCRSRWMSATHYNQLDSVLRAWGDSFSQLGEFTHQGQVEKAKTPRSAAGAIVVASGVISRDGASGTLLPLLPTEFAPRTAGSGKGDYCLRWMNGAGVTGERCFSPRFEDADGVLMDETGYSFALPVPSAADALVLFKGDRELARISAGAPPSVQILSPSANALLQGKTMVRWSGNAVSYLVQYSADNGESWDVIAPGMTDSEIEIDPAEISASQILIRVTASNGLEFATATAGPFRIPQNARLQAPPSSLDFGTIGLGDTVAKSVALRNTGTSALSVESISLESSDFIVTHSIAAAISGGGADEVSVSFRPLTAGAKRASLVIRTNDASTPTVTIDLTGGGTDVKGPRIAASPSPLDFGDVVNGQTRDVNLTVQNTGTSPLTLSALSISNARFTLAGEVNFPMDIEARSSTVIALRFSPNAVGAQTGTITIANNDAERRVDIRGNGITPPVAGAGVINVSPTSLAFGPVAVGQTPELPLTIRNTGNGNLTVSAITGAAAPFSVIAAGTPFTLAAGATRNVNIRFAPTAAGAFTGTLSIASSDTARPTTTVPMTGTGTVTTAPADIVLKADSGRFDNAFGSTAAAASVYFVVRLTPPSYPATLKSVQLFFGNRTDGLRAGDPITVLAAANTGGTATIDGVVFQRTSERIARLGDFNTLAVTPLTIRSGDFVVGFVAANPANIYPADLDEVPPSQRRSYVSATGQTFFLLDTIAPPGGNYGIRAVVTPQ